MVRSKDGVLITKEEYENLEKKMKQIVEVVIKGTTMVGGACFPDDVKEIADALLPLMGDLQTNAANLAFDVVKKELFEG